jgi:hypothetical protein
MLKMVFNPQKRIVKERKGEENPQLLEKKYGN